MNIIFPSLFSLVFLIIGGAVINYAVRIATRARQSLSWPSTEGEIAHAALVYQPETGVSSSITSTYKADIGYRYKVNGANYSSSRISLLDLASAAPGPAQGVVLRYPEKSRVHVYYDPSDPSKSVLEPGRTRGIGYLYFIGGISTAGGLFFLIMSTTGHVRMAS
jgi:hypothetical protein